MKIDVDEILDFWFADSAKSDDKFIRRMDVWFSNSDSFDLAIKQRYESVVEVVASGRGRYLESDPRGILALIITLDQFPRNIYRGTARAFAYDSEALRLTRKVIDSGMDKSMGYLEKLFAYMPLQHSEDLNVQNLSVEMFKSKVESAETQVQSEKALESVQYAELHRDIIKQFGRFPHRNEILDRESTAEELKYLADGAENFGQVKK